MQPQNKKKQAKKQKQNKTKYPIIDLEGIKRKKSKHNTKENRETKRKKARMET